MTRLAAHQLPAARLRDALRAGGLDDLPDADLLDRFARYGEHAAFEVLLRRHGPMVFGVCRRILANPADVDDAFQATFLVFVRKARAVRRGDRLGPWLYGVAVRVAMKARSRAARLAARHSEATDMIPDPTEPGGFPDWLPILDSELSALPAKYREPLVLCELQGSSRADAAKALGIPEGTLSSRLARGRELLRKRLLKHGTLLPAGGLATLFTASGVGRATVPATLLAKTSEVAVISATGAASAGAVPVGAARLTDEVLKGMFITKLRTASVAMLVVGLAAVGLAANWPEQAAGQPDRPKAKAADAKPQPAASVATGPKMADRDALQGLWVVEKLEAGKTGKDESREMARAMEGKMQFLFAGEMCWNMMAAPHGQVAPLRVKLDSSKNPKWLDLIELGGGDAGRCIYQLDGDRLTIASGGKPEIRPAEFTTEDDATPLMVFHFRREKLPPAAGEKALVGSWMEGDGTSNRRADGSPGPVRVEILDGFLFAQLGDDSRKWLGGKYTVDATKNPKWIDLELIASHDEKIAKLYGCYEVADGQLKLALGLDGKRVTRPLELKQENDMLYFDLKATKEPLTTVERTRSDTTARKKQPPQDLPPPAVLKVPEPPAIALPKVDSKPQANPVQPLPELPPALPKPKVENQPVPNPMPKLPDLPPADSKPRVEDKPAPAPKAELVWGEDVRQFIQTRDFVKAEKAFRRHLAESSGLSRAIYQLWLGICLLERTKTTIQADADKAKLHDEAAQLFRDVIVWADETQKASNPTSKQISIIRTHAELYGLLALQQQGKADEVIAAAEELWVKHRGTVEELIVMSIAYHAYKQMGKSDKAEGVRHTMKELFGKLKDNPDAFRAPTGEWSRAYWEKVWFAPS